MNRVTDPAASPPIGGTPAADSLPSEDNGERHAPWGRRLLTALDPRNSLAARLGWAHTTIALLTALVASLWLATAQRERIEEGSGLAFQQYATQISNEIDAQLNAKLQWLAASAAVFGYMPVAEREHRATPLLGEFRKQLPEFEWIALAHPDGKLAAVDGDLELNRPVNHEAWFHEGLRALWVDDLNWRRGDHEHRAVSPGFLRLSAPVHDAQGKLIGVLAAQLSLDWVKAFGAELTESLRARRSVQVLVINEAGVLLFGPPQTLGQAIPGQPSPDILRAAESLRNLRASGQVRRDTAPAGHVVSKWPDGAQYLAGWALSDGYGRFPGMGWTVWVREPTRQAFAFARAQQLRLLLVVLISGIAIIIVGLTVTRRLTRHLADIARSADDIRAGRRADLVVTEGRDEAARIGHSLQALLAGLQARTRALEELNRELDARVAARSREVERLADENRHAALMRERLRLARDLHDTLAQSLMSLLTEIRLMRKLARSDPQALPDELARAEQAAREGLHEAREAIVRLRQHPVRDTGLGAALDQLVERTAERSGLELRHTIDPSLLDLADSRAEGVYRITEEALRNVQRHAHAQHVTLNVARLIDGETATMQLSITDDGVGFDPERQDLSGHFGIQGMHEQAELIGATVAIDSSLGDGTTVTLSMPL